MVCTPYKSVSDKTKRRLCTHRFCKDVHRGANTYYCTTHSFIPKEQTLKKTKARNKRALWQVFQLRAESGSSPKKEFLSSFGGLFLVGLPSEIFLIRIISCSTASGKLLG